MCQYSDIFGQPNKGVHSYRINLLGFNLALVDIIGTLIISVVIAYYMAPSNRIEPLHIFLYFIALWGLGILLHYLFCVDTPLVKYLFQ